MTLDNGKIIDRPKFHDAAIRRIKHLQRSLLRKKKRSKNRKKAKILLAKAWRKVRLQREDYCQKVTTSLAKKFQKIVFERLDIANMVRGRIAKQIYDATWLTNPAYTTQKCSRCGWMSEGKIGLEVRTYRCKECGLIIDRDHNAAINIKSGLERTHVEKLPLLTSERKEHVASMKQEAHILKGVGF